MPHLHRCMTAMLVLLGAQGCGGGYATPALISSDVTGDSNAATSPADTSATSFTWNNGAKAVFATSCGSCHPALDPTFDASVLASVKSAYTDIMGQISTNAMPLGEPLNAATKAQLAAWGTAGNP